MQVIDKEQVFKTTPSPAGKDELTALNGGTDSYKDILNSVLLMISKEFIKPLTSVKGYMGLLEKSFQEMGGAEEKEINYFRKSAEAVNHLEALIRMCVQRLRVNKAGQIVGEMNKICLGDFVNEIREKYCKRPERVINEIDNNVPNVRLRSKYLEIVLGNLFSNAEKFGGDSKFARVTANLSKDKTFREENVLVISVCDYGIGIPEDMMGKVFLPFFQAKSSDTGDGLGLGLTMFEDAVSVMDWKIDLESVEGRGTRVIVSVPVIITDDQFLDKTV